jgi:Leucine-rich repeat (LRR) protein
LNLGGKPNIRPLTPKRTPQSDEFESGAETKYPTSSPLKELHNLTNLYLIDNQISDLSPLKELHNLTSLNLGRKPNIRPLTPKRTPQSDGFVSERKPNIRPLNP